MIKARIRDLTNPIRWAYQRVIRGYDDRATWSFENILDYAIVPLKKICEFNISECQNITVYEETFKKICEFESLELELCELNIGDPDYIERTMELSVKIDTAIEDLWYYVGNNILVYWT